MYSTISTDLDVDKKHSKLKPNMFGVLHSRQSLNKTSITNTSPCGVFCVNIALVSYFQFRIKQNPEELNKVGYK